MKLPLLFVTSTLIVALASCSGDGEKKAVELKTFPLKGEVLKVDSARSRLLVAHEEIPGYMAAMTMPFRVKDPEILLTVSVGDSITATLVVSRHESWIENVQPAGRGPVRTLTPDEVAAKRLFADGEVIDGPSFTDQNGRSFSLRSLRGKVVAVTFIYTLCPLPDFCLRMTNSFSRAQELLKKERRLSDRWHLVSLSFDPERDIPEILKAYGVSHGADLSTWTLATAPRKEISAFAGGFGLMVGDAENGVIDHNLRTVILDRDGHFVKSFTGNDWTPEELVKAMKDAM